MALGWGVIILINTSTRVRNPHWGCCLIMELWGQNERHGGFSLIETMRLCRGRFCLMNHKLWFKCHHIDTFVSSVTCVTNKKMSHQFRVDTCKRHFAKKNLRMCQHRSFKRKTARELTRTGISAESCKLGAALLWSMRALPLWSANPRFSASKLRSSS